MKILCINGSPTKKKGMTDIAIDLIMEGAGAAGAETEKIYLADKKINYCTGCFSCWLKTPGTCIFKDDMPELLDKVKNSDILLIGTPLYVDGMTAQTKTFVDRIIPLVEPEFEMVDGHYRHAKRLESIPDIALLSVCGFYELDNFDGLVDHVKRICKNFRSNYLGAVLKPYSYSLVMDELVPDHVKDIKTALKKAGSELAENKKFEENTLNMIASQPFKAQDALNGANMFWDLCRKKKEFIYHRK
ncbi:MAG: flavodoxin family protein [Desulfobacteraceae bacterium]|nr:flavodoxin family protein [Desulfobacteraceae bacterium]MCB9495059.1 flavodoxin family protein [Desulfobacteraceae bacterium]